MLVEMLATDRLTPYEHNPRRNAGAVAGVAASLREFGWRQPIVVDESLTVVVGHTRLAAALSLGMAEVPVHIARGLTPQQLRAYRLADNRTGEDAEWDDALLAGELLALKADDYDLSLTAFGEDEIGALLSPNGGVLDGADVDEVPPLPATPITKLGDLITLGRHRLLCGDATKTEDVARLMGEHRAGLMNIDPPYGVAYANDDRPNPGVAKPRVANDALSNDNLQAFLESAFRAARDHALAVNAAWYFWHAHLTQGYFAAAAAAAADVLLHRQIIWVKPVLLLTRGQYHWKHEPCFMGWVRGHEPPDYGRGEGERDQTTVWEVASVTHAEREEFQHSTPKPVGLFDGPIVKHLRRGEIAYDPFAGSGPQFIAAEKTGRACYGMDISPAYCDVIVTRWENATGQKAVRP